MKKYIILSTLIIGLLQFEYAHAQEQQNIAPPKGSSDALYTAAIVSTLGLGLAMQVVGISLFAYSQQYYFNTLSPLRNQVNSLISSEATKNELAQTQATYDTYFISSVTLLSIGAASTITGIGLALHKTIKRWDDSTAVALMKNVSSIETQKTKLSIYPIPFSIVIRIK